jgi:hypothetical protein
VNPKSSYLVHLVAMLVALSAPIVAAGQSSPSDAGAGLWWEVSAGAGGARLTCHLCDPTRQIGPVLGAAVGAYASPRVRMGVEGRAWSNDDGDVRESVYEAGLTTQLHPRRGSGLHLVGGVGWSGYRAESFAYDAVRLTLGVGWDLPLVGPWLVGNRLAVDSSSFASLQNEDVTVAPSVGLSVLRFTVFLRNR